VRRLYLKLYVAFLGIVLTGTLAVGLAWHLFDGGEEASRQRLTRAIVELVAKDLARFDPSEQSQELARLSGEVGLNVELLDPNGQPLATSHGEYWSTRSPLREGFFHSDGAPGRLFRLDDGRWMAVFFARPESHQRFVFMLALFALAIAAGCYPLARQITRRLEHLQESVNAFGAGTLETRAKVRGSDEVARLAQSFNDAAEKIQALVAKERRMLASASHELRSPLARVRMAIELMENAEPKRRRELAQEVSRDVEELDALVEDLLTSVRTSNGAQKRELELTNLVAEEAARYGLSVEGPNVTLHGDRRMLTRLTRNLIENARQHGKGAAIHTQVSATPTRARIVVEDEGPGVTEAERERIFEPFYRPSTHDEGEHGGVGLGLSLVRQIAQHHGGHAWVEARSGGGSRFVVELSKG
jgi:signal transduction histidine kinase